MIHIHIKYPISRQYLSLGVHSSNKMQFSKCHFKTTWKIPYLSWTDNGNWERGFWFLFCCPLGDNITNLNAPRTKILLKTYGLKSRNFTIYLEKHAYLICLDKNHYRNYNNINVPSEPAELHSTLYQEFIMHNYFNYSKLSKVGQEELHVLKDINKMGKVMESQMGVYEIYNCPKKMAIGLTR